VGVRKPGGLELLNVFRGIRVDDEGRGWISSPLLLLSGVFPSSLHTAVSTVLIPGPSLCVRWYRGQHASQADIVQWAGHPPLGLVDRLPLLRTAVAVSLDGRIFLYRPYRPCNRSQRDRLYRCHGVLTLNYSSHIFGVAEELIVLPIIEEEVLTLSSFRLLIGAPGGPSDGGLVARAFP
jgi:hypothetical protein